MRRFIVATAVGFAIAVVALAHAGAALAQETDSGFLRDYARLEETQDGAGTTTRAWVSPKFTPDNYNALLIDPIVFYPEPRPTEKVSAETLQQILAYINDLAKRTLSERFNVVDQAGPGVLRIRAAFTSVGAKGEGLKPYQYIPIALVAAMARRAGTGGAPRRATIVVEVEVTDSASGELMAERVRSARASASPRLEKKTPSRWRPSSRFWTTLPGKSSRTCRSTSNPGEHPRRHSDSWKRTARVRDKGVRNLFPGLTA